MEVSRASWEASQVRVLSSLMAPLSRPAGRRAAARLCQRRLGRASKPRLPPPALAPQALLLCECPCRSLSSKRHPLHYHVVPPPCRHRRCRAWSFQLRKASLQQGRLRSPRSWQQPRCCHRLLPVPAPCALNAGYFPPWAPGRAGLGCPLLRLASSSPHLCRLGECLSPPGWGPASPALPPPPQAGTSWAPGRRRGVGR